MHSGHEPAEFQTGLQVVIERGHQIPAVHTFVVATLDGEQRETGLVCGDQNPLWDETLSFAPPLLYAGARMEFEVFEQDEFCGRLLVASGSTLLSGTSKSRKILLSDVRGRSAGCLHVSFCGLPTFLHLSQENVTPPSGPEMRVEVSVWEGFLLPTMSAFVVARVGDHCERTETATGDMCPLWDENLQFNVKTHAPEESTIHFQVFQDSDFSGPVLIGTGSCPVFAAASSATSQQISLHDRRGRPLVGYLRINVRYLGLNDATQDSSSPSKSRSQQRAGTPTPQRARNAAKKPLTADQGKQGGRGTSRQRGRPIATKSNAKTTRNKTKHTRNGSSQRYFALTSRGAQGP